MTTTDDRTEATLRALEAAVAEAGMFVSGDHRVAEADAATLLGYAANYMRQLRAERSLAPIVGIEESDFTSGFCISATVSAPMLDSCTMGACPQTSREVQEQAHDRWQLMKRTLLVVTGLSGFLSALANLGDAAA
jgi:hypothetical protein